MFPDEELLSERHVLLASLPIEHTDANDPRRAASWFATYRTSHGVGMLDCLIAAAAL